VKKRLSYSLVFGSALCFGAWAAVGQAHGDDHSSPHGDQPSVFQAAGPNAASIQSVVDQFRAALGGVNNGNAAGPLAGGRREINWDGGGSSATAIAPTPFEGFLITRGARFTTEGTGFVQAPPSGLAATFGNPTYADIFKPFSALRLFSPVDGNVTRARFFVPGGGDLAATTTGFGAVFADVDQQDGDRSGDDDHGGHKSHGSLIEYFGVRGDLLYSSVVPASPGDATLSFFGIIFKDARIARVRITAGDAAPGPNDTRKRDIVVMDDFIYGEPRIVQ
jgi:hypothetical protein